MNIKFLVVLAAISRAPMPAQLASPNQAGVAIGHVHVNARDIEAQQRFWTLLGGTPVNNEKLQMVQFPGIYIVLRKQEPTGGTVGSVINHIGFTVKSLPEWLQKWKAAGLMIEPGRSLYLTGPDDIRVEIFEDASIATPIAMNHIHMFLPDPLAAQDWYGKNFGAVAITRNPLDPARHAGLPGAELTLGNAATPVEKQGDMHQAPTKGRSLDHIGFEVKNLDQFVKNLEAAGIHTEAPIRASANASKLRIAYITDPWGTYIELTEGLAPTPAQSANR